MTVNNENGSGRCVPIGAAARLTRKIRGGRSVGVAREGPTAIGQSGETRGLGGSRTVPTSCGSSPCRSTYLESKLRMKFDEPIARGRI